MRVYVRVSGDWQAVGMDGRLLLEDDLTQSAVVANSAMNRERQLAGVNSYTRELGFNPLDRVRSMALRGRHGSWLDLCAVDFDTFTVDVGSGTVSARSWPGWSLA